MKKLGFRERMMILGGAIIIIIAAWFYMYYNPMRLKIAGINRETEDFKNRIQNVESLSKEIKTLNQQIEDLKERNEQNQSKILAKQRVDRVGEIIGEKAREFSLDIRSIIPEKEALFSDTTGTGMVSRIPFHLFIWGKFFDFGKFLESFEDFPFLIKAGPVSMSTDDETYPALIIQSMVYVYFFKE